MNIAYKISLLVVMFAGCEAGQLNAASTIQHSTLQQINIPTMIITFNNTGPLLPNSTVVPIAESRKKTQLNTYMSITESSTKPETRHNVTPRDTATETSILPKTVTIPEKARSNAPQMPQVLEQECKQKVAVSHIHATRPLPNDLIRQAKQFEIQHKNREAFALYEQAEKLYRHPKAQLALGLCYLTGTIVPFARAKGFKLLKQSAAQGNPNAMLRLAYLLQNGIGVQESDIIEYQGWGEANTREMSSETSENQIQAKEYISLAISKFGKNGEKEYKRLFDKFRKDNFGLQKTTDLPIFCARNEKITCPLCDTSFVIGQQVRTCDCCNRIFHDVCIKNRLENFRQRGSELIGIDAVCCPGWCYNYSWPLLCGKAMSVTTKKS